MSVETPSWDILANYESAELVRQQFRKRHGGTLNAGKAREICAAFVQARGYMESARAADRNVRPLLAYYGVLSLSRALTLFLSPRLREAGLAQSHGLSVDSWGEELSRERGDVGALTIKLSSQGTFQQLLAATEYKSHLRSNSSRPNFTVAFDPLPPDTHFTLADLLSRLPEIRTVYERWRGPPTMIGMWPQKRRPDGSMEIRVDFGGYDGVKAIFGELEICEPTSVLHFVLPAGKGMPHVSDAGGAWDIGNLVAMPAFPGDFAFSKIGTAFVVSYALGMLVRYYPSHWVGMLHNQRHDAALPSLMAALKHVEEDFPRFVVEFLEVPTDEGGSGREEDPAPDHT